MHFSWYWLWPQVNFVRLLFAKKSCWQITHRFSSSECKYSTYSLKFDWHMSNCFIKLSLQLSKVSLAILWNLTFCWFNSDFNFLFSAINFSFSALYFAVYYLSYLSYLSTRTSSSLLSFMFYFLAISHSFITASILIERLWSFSLYYVIIFLRSFCPSEAFNLFFSITSM